jgi:hypothetical protein
MTIDEIIAELLGKAEKQPEHERDAFIAKNNPVNIGPFTHYRDGARNLNTLIIMGATFTFADAPYLCGFAYTMPRRSGGGAKIKIENGNQSAACANNFVEFDYIARGSHYMQIEGLDYTFNQGEILFLNRDSSFKE